MNRILLLVLPPLLFAGCVGVTVNRAPPRDTVVVPVTTADSATIAEINAAAALNFDDSRAEALQAIARRPMPSPAVQVHLVTVAYRHLAFEDAKVRVLRAVIANPSFCDAAKQSILTQLGRLAFEDSKRQILAALNARAAESPGLEPAAH